MWRHFGEAAKVSNVRAPDSLNKFRVALGQLDWSYLTSQDGVTSFVAIWIAAIVGFGLITWVSAFMFVLTRSILRGLGYVWRGVKFVRRRVWAIVLLIWRVARWIFETPIASTAASFAWGYNAIEPHVVVLWNWTVERFGSRRRTARL